jgi:uncharacterized protein
MAKTRTTLTVDEEVLRAVKIRAARTGKGDSEIIEEALRRDLGLDLLERIWTRNDLGEDEAVALAVEAQHRTRPAKRWVVRVILDPNVIISALLSASGSPARVLRNWLDGNFELVVSPLLLEELVRALGYPKLRARISEAEADELIEVLRRQAEIESDPAEPPHVRSSDVNDNYTIALAASTRSAIVSGDHHLLDLRADLPIYSPNDFLAHLESFRG